MNILKALLAALGAFVGLIVVGILIGTFMAPGPAYALGQMVALLDIVLAISVFFYAKRKFDKKKKEPIQSLEPMPLKQHGPS